MEMTWGLLLTSGSGVAPPHPARPAALPGLSFGLGTASDGTDSEAPSRWDGPGSSSIRLLAEGKRLRSLEYGNEMGVFIKIGLRSRATAPGPTCSASGSLIRARHRVRRGGVPSRW